jgi:hypothetical protein
MPLFDWIAEAVSGPGALRFIIQPLLALLLAARDGVRDARVGSTPFVYRLLFGRHDRRALLRSAWKTVAIPLVVAFLLDSVLQVVITGAYRPRESLAVGLLLVGLPYSIARGLICRLADEVGRRRRAA